MLGLDAQLRRRMEVLILWLQTEATNLCHVRLDSDLSVSRGRGGELDVISEE